MVSLETFSERSFNNSVKISSILGSFDGSGEEVAEVGTADDDEVFRFPEDEGVRSGIKVSSASGVSSPVKCLRSSSFAWQEG